MPIKKIIVLIFIFIFSSQVIAEEVKKMGKHKDWETYIIKSDAGKVCFAQSKPVLQAPKTNQREARLFITFRPSEKITNEISITSGYEFNKKNSITAISGKYKYNFDMAQDGFAWMAAPKQEKKRIKLQLVAANEENRILQKFKEDHLELLSKKEEKIKGKDKVIARQKFNLKTLLDNVGKLKVMTQNETSLKAARGQP